MADRREFPAAVFRAAFTRSGAICEVHRLPAGVLDNRSPCNRVAAELDHILPDCLGGEPTLENSAYICRACHLEKTQLDASARKKRNHHRVRDDRPLSYSARKADGHKKSIPSRPFDKRFKKKLDGTVVRRAKG